MHSDQIRNRLQQRREELRARVDHVASDLRGETVPAEGGFADHATAHSNDDVLEAIRETSRTELRQIDNALDRLAKGQYDRCERCGAAIGQERLRALPYATTCVACAS